MTTTYWLTTGLAGCSRSISAGEYILRQGEEGGSMYYILSGDVLVVLDEIDRAPVAELGAGQLFGEMAALAGGRRSASVIASTPCELLELRPAQLREAFRRHPDLRERLGRLGLARAEANLDCMRRAA